MSWASCSSSGRCVGCGYQVGGGCFGHVYLVGGGGSWLLSVSSSPWSTMYLYLYWSEKITTGFGMLPLVDRECYHWILPLVEINVHHIEMLPLDEREYHHYILPLVERNMHQGLPLVESGGQGLPLVDSGDQGPMDPSNRPPPPFLLRGIGGKCCTFGLPISATDGVSHSSNKSCSHLKKWWRIKVFGSCKWRVIVHMELWYD